MVQKVNNCCCFTLPVGAEILGWLGIIVGVFDIFALVGILISHGKKHTIVATPFIGSMVSCLVVIFVSALLNVGTREKSHNKILPWLILQTIELVCKIIGVLALLGAAIFSLCFGTECGLQAFIMVAFALFVAAWAGLNYYFIIAMYSHYKNIRDESRRAINHADAERLNPAP